MKKVALIALGVTILFGSYLYAETPAKSTPVAIARQNRINFTCPATEPEYTCHADADTKNGIAACTENDIAMMLNFGNAIKIVEIADEWAKQKNIDDPDNGPWYAYEYFNQRIKAGNIAGLIGVYSKSGCTPLHFIAVRKCFTGNRSVPDSDQIKAIETIMTWGIDGETPNHQKVDPFAFNSACQFTGLHVVTAVRGYLVEMPATIGYLAAENLNPNIIQAMYELYNTAKNDTDGCNRRYKNTKTKKYQVFIKELATGTAVGHVGDAQGVVNYYTKAKYNSLPVSGYDRVCIADFYNSFGNSYNAERGPTFTAFDQRSATLTKGWDKDERTSLGFKKRIQIPQDGTHFVENLGTAIAYGLPLFERSDNDVYKPPLSVINLNKVQNMDKGTRIASATLMSMLSEKVKISDVSDVAVLNKYPEDKYTVAFKKDNTDVYPTDILLAQRKCVVPKTTTCTPATCNYVSCNVKTLTVIESTLIENDIAAVNSDLDKTYSKKPYENVEKDRM